MTRIENYLVGESEAGQRLDRWFKKQFAALSHGRLEKLLRTGQVRIDGKRIKAGARLVAGQVIRIPPLPSELESMGPGARTQTKEEVSLTRDERQALEQSVLYRDEWVLAINKPPGLAVQGGSGLSRHLDAMLEGLRFGARERPRLVHRLDRDTSGVLLLARTTEAARALAASFKGGRVEKTYWAAVAGVPRMKRGRIDMPLSKRSGARGERVAEDRQSGKTALTVYQVVARYRNKAAWLVLSPRTGRTHQLRVHCAMIGHPILGDGKYGGKAAFLEDSYEIKRLHLHAREIALLHPHDGTTLRIAAPIPEHMQRTWAGMGFDEAAGQGISLESPN